MSETTFRIIVKEYLVRVVHPYAVFVQKPIGYNDPNRTLTTSHASQYTEKGAKSVCTMLQKKYPSRKFEVIHLDEAYKIPERD